MSTYHKYNPALLTVRKQLSSGGALTTLTASAISCDTSYDLGSNGALLVQAGTCSVTYRWLSGKPPPGTLPDIGDVIEVAYSGVLLFYGRVRDRSYTEESNPIHSVNNRKVISWSVTAGDACLEFMARTKVFPKGLPRERALTRLLRFVNLQGGFPGTAADNPYVAEESKGFHTQVSEQLRAFSDASGIAVRPINSTTVDLLSKTAALKSGFSAAEAPELYSSYAQQITGGQYIASFEAQFKTETGTAVLKSDDMRLPLAGFKAADWLPVLNGSKLGQVTRYSWNAVSGPPGHFTHTAELKFGSASPQASIPRPPSEPLIRTGPAGYYHPGTLAADPSGRLFVATGDTDLAPGPPLTGTAGGQGPWPLEGSVGSVGGLARGWSGFLDVDQYPGVTTAPRTFLGVHFSVAPNNYLTTYDLALSAPLTPAVAGGFTIGSWTATVTNYTTDNPGGGAAAGLGMTLAYIDTNNGTPVPYPAPALAAATGNGVYTVPALAYVFPTLADLLISLRIEVDTDAIGNPVVADLLYEGGSILAGGEVPKARVLLGVNNPYGTVSNGVAPVAAINVEFTQSPPPPTATLPGSIEAHHYFGPAGYWTPTQQVTTTTTVADILPVIPPNGLIWHHTDVYYVQGAQPTRYVGTVTPQGFPNTAPCRIAKDAEWGDPWEAEGGMEFRIERPTRNSGGTMLAEYAIATRPLTGSEAFSVQLCHEDARTDVNPQGTLGGAPTVLNSSSLRTDTITIPPYLADPMPDDKYFFRVSWTNASGAVGSVALIGGPYDDRPGNQSAQWSPL